MAAETIMIQGTGSDVGKSVITAGLCRLFSDLGYRTAPFKSQNMALNSCITQKGGEIGRAQVVQAEAARVVPTVDMNPVLLKPNEDNNSQVIIRGTAQENMTAKEYYSRRDSMLKVMRESLMNLKKEYDLVVIEGAGSPAEINLRDYDMVNMKIAELAEAPVILIADIDKGGVFASVVGTLELLTSEERERVKGIIINKFRGDQSRFERGKVFIEEYTSKPVLGIIPYFTEFKIPEEDSLSDDNQTDEDYQIDIAVIYLPHISNFTDFDLLSFEPGTRVRYVEDSTELGEPDLIIIPGSKNTTGDLDYLYQKGLVQAVKRKHALGVEIVGICGGYQMLGRKIYDPEGLESGQEQIDGLGLLEMETVIAGKKITRWIEGELVGDLSFFNDLQGERVRGYEIHHGKSSFSAGANHLMNLCSTQVQAEGLISDDGSVWGTYLHGIFDNDHFRRVFINYLRQKKGLDPLAEKCISSREEREKAYDSLAQVLKENIDCQQLEKIIFGKG